MNVSSVKLSNRQRRIAQNKRLAFIGTTTTTSGTTKATILPCEDKHSLCCFWAITGECEKNPFWMKLNCARTCGTCTCSLGNADRCSSTGIRCTLITSTIKEKTSFSTTTQRRTTEILTTTVSSIPPSKKRTRPHTPPINGFRRTKTTPAGKKKQSLATTTQMRETTNTKTTTAYFTSVLETCRDNHNECNFWAMLGECRSNPYYMRPNCQKSCGSCGEHVSSVYAPTPRPGCDNGNFLCNYWAHIGECEANANYMVLNCRLACRIC